MCLSAACRSMLMLSSCCPAVALSPRPSYPAALPRRRRCSAGHVVGSSPPLRRLRSATALDRWRRGDERPPGRAGGRGRGSRVLASRIRITGTLYSRSLGAMGAYLTLTLTARHSPFGRSLRRGEASPGSRVGLPATVTSGQAPPRWGRLHGPAAWGRAGGRPGAASSECSRGRPPHVVGGLARTGQDCVEGCGSTTVLLGPPLPSDARLSRAGSVALVTAS